jgi:hypothetical protein
VCKFVGGSDNDCGSGMTHCISGTRLEPPGAVLARAASGANNGETLGGHIAIECVLYRGRVHPHRQWGENRWRRCLTYRYRMCSLYNVFS